MDNTKMREQELDLWDEKYFLDDDEYTILARNRAAAIAPIKRPEVSSIWDEERRVDDHERIEDINGGFNSFF